MEDEIEEVEGKKMISFDEFVEASDKLDIRMGKVTKVEEVSKNGKYLKLTVDFGPEIRTVVTNMGADFSPQEFAGAFLPFVMNMPQREISGHMSQAMILPGETENGMEITLTPGAKIL